MDLNHEACCSKERSGVAISEPLKMGAVVNSPIVPRPCTSDAEGYKGCVEANVGHTDNAAALRLEHRSHRVQYSSWVSEMLQDVCANDRIKWLVCGQRAEHRERVSVYDAIEASRGLGGKRRVVVDTPDFGPAKT